MKIPVNGARAYAIRPYISSHNTRISYPPKSACCVIEQTDRKFPWIGSGRMQYAPPFHHAIHGFRIIRLFLHVCVCFLYDSFVPSVFDARQCLRRGGSRTARVSGHTGANGHAHTTTEFCMSGCSSKEYPLFCVLFAFLHTNVRSFRQHRRCVRVLDPYVPPRIRPDLLVSSLVLLDRWGGTLPPRQTCWRPVSVSSLVLLDRWGGTYNREIEVLRRDMFQALFCWIDGGEQCGPCVHDGWRQVSSLVLLDRWGNAKAWGGGG